MSRAAASLLAQILALALLCAYIVPSKIAMADRAPTAREVETTEEWQRLNQLVDEAYSEEDYAAGVIHAEHALDYAEQFFGANNRNTLLSLEKLSALYQACLLYTSPSPRDRG